MLGLEILDSILFGLYLLPFYVFVACISIVLMTVFAAPKSRQKSAFVVFTIEQRIASKADCTAFDNIINLLSRRNSWNIYFTGFND